MAEERQLLQGELYHREKSQKYLYVLDQEIGAIYCFKRKVNQIRSKVIILSGCSFPDYPNSVLIGSEYYPSFDCVVDEQVYAVIVLEGQDCASLRSVFSTCAQLPVPLLYRKCCRFFRGLGFIISIPFKISSVIIKGLETVGDKFNEAPDRVFKGPIKENKRKSPGNLASGLFIGTGKMLIGIAKGIGGLVYEPIKGAKESGFKGATKGFGKGILGLVCKPVAGTIDFVTCTFRGVSNTPASFYKSALNIYKKKKARQAKEKKWQDLQNVDYQVPAEIIFEDFKDEENKLSSDEDNMNKIDESERIEGEDLIYPILDRNSKLREWIMQLASVLDKELELLYEDLDSDDLIELRVQEAKQIGKKLKKTVMELIEEVHNFHSQNGFNVETYYDFNAKMVAGLKEIGVTVKDEFVLDIASMIEDSLLSSEDESEPETKVQEEELKGNRLSFKPTEKKEKIVMNPFIEKAKEWRPSEFKDNYRVPEAGPKGGIPLADSKVQAQLRAVANELIKTIGRKVLQGDFNLTTISFPIKCMQPTTSLHNILRSMTLGPLYLTRAGLISNPIERLKLIAIATMGTYRNTATFLKPVSVKLNPIIGETLYAQLDDGTQMYCEQTCNHPPISHFYVVGPDSLYKLQGYSQYVTSAGFNSLTIRNTGKKTVVFKDGTTITITFPDDQFVNTFVMTIRQETVGEIEIDDKKNNLQCLIKIGSVKNKTTDFVEGVIIEDKKRIVSKLSGTYLGYLEFDGIRYWDAREFQPFPLVVKNSLPSDSEYRNDLILLQDNRVEEAQAAKEQLESTQRSDRKMRESYKKK